jgi:hypothetical protein
LHWDGNQVQSHNFISVVLTFIVFHFIFFFLFPRNSLFFLHMSTVFNLRHQAQFHFHCGAVLLVSICNSFFVLIRTVGGRVQLGPLGTAATYRPTKPAPGDYDAGEISGMIGRGHRSTRRKPAPVPLCPLQTPYATRTRTRAAAVGSQRLTD